MKLLHDGPSGQEKPGRLNRREAIDLARESGDAAS